MDLVGITARLPDPKKSLSSTNEVDAIAIACRDNMGMGEDELSKLIDRLDKVDAAKPSVEATRNLLKTPQALLQVCTALQRLWSTSDPTKPQVSVASKPNSEVKRTAMEHEAWKTILGS
jgi:hypothetical protein